VSEFRRDLPDIDVALFLQPEAFSKRMRRRAI